MKRIILIDDDIDDREIFVSALSDACADAICITFSSAVDALAELKNIEELPDYIFVDMNMPVMDGAEFLREFKYLNLPKLISIFIYTTAFNYNLVNIEQLGACGYVVKPSKYRDLVDKLEDILKTPNNPN